MTNRRIMNTAIITVITAVTLVVSGAFAGFVTNKYAVRWLFKPVSVFGKQVFDVSILSTDRKQEAFIESLSDCVERRILTTDVIKHELINDVVRNHLDEIVEVFLSESMPEGLRRIKISEVEDFDDLTADVRKLIADMADENLGGLLSCLLDEVKLSDYLTASQIDRGVDNVYEAVKIALKENYAIKDFISRIVGELFLVSMFDRDGRTALAKLAGRFFKSGPARPGGFGPFYMDSLSLPEKIRDSIKEIIIRAVEEKLKGKSLGELLSDDVKTELEKTVNKQGLKILDEKLENLSEEKVRKFAAKAFEKLSEREGVKKGIGDLVFTFIEEHIEGMLEGKVKQTVKTALGKLDPDQLLEIAERLMRGQLAYLSYFGAVIGFIISIPALIITLGSFTVTGFPDTPLLLLFLMCLMGAIGVLTNVIAIQMFFHPYKPIAFLAKFKRTKVFSVGIILQNQKPFANTLGEYVGSTLLTAENIIDTLRKNEIGLEDSIGKTVVCGIKEWINNDENRKEVSDKLSEFLLTTLDTNRLKLSNMICSGVGEKNICEYINLNDPETREKADAIFDRLLDMLAENRFGESLEVLKVGEDEDASDFRFITCALARLIRKTPSLKENVREVILIFAANEFANKGLGDIFSMKEAGDCLEKNIHSIAVSEAAYISLLNAVNVCCSAFVSRFTSIVPEKTVSAIASTGAKAGFEAIIGEVPALAEDINIGKVTEEKVAALEPEEIKNVIMSFAGEAIHKLYVLGLIGCVFGINTYLAFLVFVIDKAEFGRQGGRRRSSQ